MTRTVLAACLVTALASTGAASAQTVQTNLSATADPDVPVGKQANTFMVRLRAIGVLPQDSSSSISGIGGHVTASDQAAPEVDLSYFLTDHIAFEAIAASTRHVLHAENTALGTVDVGNTWVLPPTLTVEYHFMPHERFSPYVGAGLNLTFFYDTNAAGGPVNHLSIANKAGPVVQVGFDYNIMGHWFANFDVKQIFVKADASLDYGAIRAKTGLNPTVVGAGIGYRF